MTRQVQDLRAGGRLGIKSVGSYDRILFRQACEIVSDTGTTERLIAVEHVRR